MTNINHQENLNLCKQYFPKLTWKIESGKTSAYIWVDYCGESDGWFDIKVSQCISGYSGEMRMNYDITFIGTEVNSDLEVVLQQIKDEWLKIVNEVL
jgi:hypothetical protein